MVNGGALANIAPMFAVRKFEVVMLGTRGASANQNAFHIPKAAHARHVYFSLSELPSFERRIYTFATLISVFS